MTAGLRGLGRQPLAVSIEGVDSAPHTDNLYSILADNSVTTCLCSASYAGLRGIAASSNAKLHNEKAPLCGAFITHIINEWLREVGSKFAARFRCVRIVKCGKNCGCSCAPIDRSLPFDVCPMSTTTTCPMIYRALARVLAATCLRVFVIRCCSHGGLTVP